MVQFRKDHPILRQKRFLHSIPRRVDGKPDLFWWKADGSPMTDADWGDGNFRHVCCELLTASGTPEYAVLEYAIFAVFNAGPGLFVTLPDPSRSRHWVRHVDTAQMPREPRPVGQRIRVAANSVAVLVQEAR